MKYYGKEKCKILKQIRAEIARQNDIEWVVSECKHQGNCRGTCPKCEAEVRQLEDALARREALGKTVAVMGISAGIALSVTSCANPLERPLGGDHIANSSVSSEMMTSVQEGEFESRPVVDSETQTPAEESFELPVPGEVLGGVPMPGEETVEENDTESDTDADTDGETWEDVLMGDPVEVLPEPEDNQP